MNCLSPKACLELWFSAYLRSKEFTFTTKRVQMMNSPRKFKKPEITIWGHVSDLTRLGKTDGPGDAKFSDGSVYPPPFEDDDDDT